MIPEALKAIPQWVTAVNGSKQPLQASVNAGASVSKPETWTSWETAQNAVNKGYRDQVGFVFNNNGIVGIDIDDGWDDDGFMSYKAADIIGECKSYTEKSRSGRGFHILLYGELPFSGRNNQNGVEIYQTGRYFIMTGATLLYTEVVSNQAAIDYVVKKYFAQTVKESGELQINPRIYNPIWETPHPPVIQLRPIYPLIPQGSRNICLTSLAGLLHNIGYSPSAIYNELQYANSVACQPSVSDSEIMTIVGSVTRYKR